MQRFDESFDFTGSSKRVPIADGKAQPLFHRFAAYLFRCIVVLEAEDFFGTRFRFEADFADSCVRELKKCIARTRRFLPGKNSPLSVTDSAVFDRFAAGANEDISE